MGFTRVYRYTAGKADWLASDLPREGESAGTPWAGDLARPDALTCRWTDRAGEVRHRLEEAAATVCVVTDDRKVVLGLLDAAALEAADPQASVDEVMDPGPSSIRPSLPPEKAIEYMGARESLIVTTSEGFLLGILCREDLERPPRLFP